MEGTDALVSADCPEATLVDKARRPGHLGHCPINGFLFPVGAPGMKHEGLHLKWPLTPGTVNWEGLGLEGPPQWSRVTVWQWGAREGRDSEAAVETGVTESTVSQQGENQPRGLASSAVRAFIIAANWPMAFRWWGFPEMMLGTTKVLGYFPGPLFKKALN